MFVLDYEAWVHFQIWMLVQVRDSTIFEKVGCGCNGVQRLSRATSYVNLHIEVHQILSILTQIWALVIQQHRILVNPMRSLVSVLDYEARMHFRIWVLVRVRDSTIFEKVGCGCNGVQRLKNYLKYFYLYFIYITKILFHIIVNIYQFKRWYIEYNPQVFFFFFFLHIFQPIS